MGWLAWRDATANDGGGTGYVVTGHAPRHLDPQCDVVGRVVKVSNCSPPCRAAAPVGFYERPKSAMPVKTIRVAADVPVAERILRK
jgi:hypothetical protein